MKHCKSLVLIFPFISFSLCAMEPKSFTDLAGSFGRLEEHREAATRSQELLTHLRENLAGADQELEALLHDADERTKPLAQQISFLSSHGMEIADFLNRKEDFNFFESQLRKLRKAVPDVQIQRQQQFQVVSDTLEENRKAQQEKLQAEARYQEARSTIQAKIDLCRRTLGGNEPSRPDNFYYQAPNAAQLQTFHHNITNPEECLLNSIKNERLQHPAFTEFFDGIRAMAHHPAEFNEALRNAFAHCLYAMIQRQTIPLFARITSLKERLAELEGKIAPCTQAQNILPQTLEQQLLAIRKDFGRPVFDGQFVNLTLASQAVWESWANAPTNIRAIESRLNSLNNPALFDLLEKTAVAAHMNQSEQFKTILRTVIANYADATANAHYMPLSERKQKVEADLAKEQAEVKHLQTEKQQADAQHANAIQQLDKKIFIGYK